MKPTWLHTIWNKFSLAYPATAYDLNYARRYKRWEPDLWLIPRFCNKQFSSIDVGANMGIYSRWMARHSKNVESFECNPMLFPTLKNVLPNNTTLHQCALSSKNTQMTLRFDPDNTGVGTIESTNRLDQNDGIKTIQTVLVDVRKLDDFNFNKTSFIKIDVEGHELEVLKGGEQLIKRDFPTFLIEIEERHCPGNLQSVPSYLTQFGYKSFIRQQDNKLTPVTHLSDWGNKGVNNFWFIKE